MLLGATASHAEQVTWKFDNVKRIGGFATQVDGSPTVVAGPGKQRALRFDGDDSLFIEGRPLVGASQFTIEVVVRPEGGPFEQRFFHIAETDPVTKLDTGPNGDANSRFMFEVRVKDGSWTPDAYVKSKAGGKPLLALDKTQPLNRWYVVAQTYDGTTYRLYVDGVLLQEGAVAFTPHGPGHVRVGARMNQIDYFVGSIATARFTDRALAPAEFLKTKQ
jgi:hypothetical protein